MSTEDYIHTFLLRENTIAYFCSFLC